MIITVHADADECSIEQRIGLPQYSYYFAMKAFFPVLERLGILVTLRDPVSEADGVYEFARAIGKRSVFLSFAPPHLTPHALACPTIAVFPIEYYDLPTERSNGLDQNDWRWVLRRLGRAITHSSHAREVVRRALGPGFAVSALPSPVWDRWAVPACADAAPEVAPFDLVVRSAVIDSRSWQPRPAATAEALSAVATCTLPVRPTMARGYRPWRPPTRVRIGGIVYTTVFNPHDGRKNWRDIVRAFVIALRAQADATLVLKLAHRRDPDFRNALLRELQMLSPFVCRILMIEGFLDEASHRALTRNATYVVNAAAAEGQCLPLMEAMSAGVPALAPAHTAMADYVTPANAFLVASTLEPAAWPHDPQFRLRTTQHRIDAASLRRAFCESYRVARQEPERYRAMAREATRTLEQHCSETVVEAGLRRILSEVVASQPAA